MAITKMRLVNIVSDIENLDPVLERFCTLDMLHPEPAEKFVDSVKGLTTLQDANPYTDVLQKLTDLSASMNIELDYRDDDIKDVNIETYREYIDEKNNRYEQTIKAKAEVEQVVQEDKDAITQLQNLENLGISLDEIFACKYLQVRFGRLPLDSVDKLKYYNNKPFIFKSFNSDSIYSWCCYITTPKYAGEVDNVFSSLYFERIRIPEFVHGTPDKAKENMQKDIEINEQNLKHIEDVRKKILDECQTKFNEMYCKLVKLNMMFEARKYVVCLGERFSLTGFVAKDDVKTVMDAYDDMKNVEIEDRPPRSDARLTPPTKLKNGWLTRPFSFFVTMYGVPAYGELDPTPLVAISYMLLFGIMFGDLGQGLVLILVGLIAARKGMELGDIGVRIGISSSIFGVIYGSVFGYEDWLNPLYKTVFGLSEKPINVMDGNFTMTLLISAVAIGIGLIIICMFINTILNLKRKAIGEALFSQNGIAGLVMYMSIIVGAVLMVMGIEVFNIFYVLLLIVLPMILIFMKEALINKIENKPMFPDGFGSYFTESFFECFEIVLTFLANTMSFLRVGGFVLSHAGMMLVVMTLAEMVGGIFNPVIVIIGNIFVMCLEGMIVGIQVLRLEFYEMFSRYFEGKGVPFKTPKMNIEN